MDFLETLTINRSPETKRVLESLYLNHFKEYNNKDIDFLFLKWKEKGLGPRTIKKLLTIFKAWYEDTYREPANLKYYNFKIEREEPKEIKAFTKEQARKLLDYLKLEDNFYLAILIGLHTGARIGEAFSLQWSDIDWNSKKITIRRSKNGVVKNGVTRTLRMTKELEEALQKASRDSTTILKSFDINKRLAIVCRNLEIPVLSYHKMRHTFASLGLNAGVPVKEISKILGHKKVSTTLDIYWQSQKEIEIDFVP